MTTMDDIDDLALELAFPPIEEDAPPAEPLSPRVLGTNLVDMAVHDSIHGAMTSATGLWDAANPHNPGLLEFPRFSKSPEPRELTENDVRVNEWLRQSAGRRPPNRRHTLTEIPCSSDVPDSPPSSPSRLGRRWKRYLPSLKRSPSLSTQSLTSATTTTTPTTTQSAPSTPTRGHRLSLASIKRWSPAQSRATASTSLPNLRLITDSRSGSDEAVHTAVPAPDTPSRRGSSNTNRTRRLSLASLSLRRWTSHANSNTHASSDLRGPDTCSGGSVSRTDNESTATVSEFGGSESFENDKSEEEESAIVTDSSCCADIEEATVYEGSDGDTEIDESESESGSEDNMFDDNESVDSDGSEDTFVEPLPLFSSSASSPLLSPSGTINKRKVDEGDVDEIDWFFNSPTESTLESEYTWKTYFGEDAVDQMSQGDGEEGDKYEEDQEDEALVEHEDGDSDPAHCDDAYDYSHDYAEQDADDHHNDDQSLTGHSITTFKPSLLITSNTNITALSPPTATYLPDFNPRWLSKWITTLEDAILSTAMAKCLPPLPVTSPSPLPSQLIIENWDLVAKRTSFPKSRLDIARAELGATSTTTRRSGGDDGFMSGFVQATSRSMTQISESSAFIPLSLVAIACPVLMMIFSSCGGMVAPALQLFSAVPLHLHSHLHLHLHFHLHRGSHPLHDLHAHSHIRPSHLNFNSQSILELNSLNRSLSRSVGIHPPQRQSQRATVAAGTGTPSPSPIVGLLAVSPPSTTSNFLASL